MRASDSRRSVRLLENTMVTVQGTVQAINDEDEFTLVDDSGSIRVWTAGTFFTVDPGEQVTVEGFVDGNLLVENLRPADHPRRRKRDRDQPLIVVLGACRPPRPPG